MPVVSLSRAVSSSSRRLSGAAACSWAFLACGLGRAFTSTFWFTLRGMASICTVTEGTMYGGLRSRMKALRAAVSTSWSLTT